MIYRSASLSCFSALLLVACSGAPVDIGPANNADGVAGPNADSGVPLVDPAAIVGPKVTIRVRTSTAAFPHADGYSGQTTRQTKQGVRSFRLLRWAGDPSPVVVFDHGNNFVEAGYDDGDDTIIGVASLGKIPPGSYTIAQTVVTHSRYRVSSTMHPGAGAWPGEFDCVQALSDNTTLNGQPRSRGWYRYVFTTNGQSYPQEGPNAPLPTQAQTGGFTMKINGGETYYELPVSLLIPANIAGDITVVVNVNMNDAFRWEDQPLYGYTKGVYDTTPVSFEPVRRYGANSYRLTIE